MAHQWLKLAGLATLMLVVFPAVVSAQSKPAAFFVLGDSYADTGNLNKSEISWKPPYGVTWPGNPTGRGSDGYLSTDYFATFFRTPLPPPYVTVTSTKPTKYYKRGVNFAEGGAAIFPSDHSTYSQQVDQLKGLISQHPDIFSPYTLQHSIVYLSYAGNDYKYQVINNNGSTSTITPEYASSVVQGIEQTIRDLYVAGLRNFVVTYAPPLGSIPPFTANGTTGPNETFNGFASLHNQLLRTSLDKITWLPGSNVVAIDLYKTFNFINVNAKWFGFPNPGAACCLPTRQGGLCGSVDAQGNPLYTVCSNPADFFWWDDSHLTKAGWNAVTNLINSGYNYTEFSPNVVYWFNSLNLTDVTPRDEGRVAGDVQRALQAVNQTGQYNIIWDIVDRSNLLQYAPEILSQTFRITLFLPTDAALIQLSGNPVATFLRNSPEVVLGALSLHAVYGWWPAQRLLALPSGSTLKTVAGTDIAFYNEPAGLFVRAPQAEGGVRVVQPDIASFSYTGAIHGIDGVFIPTYIRPLPGAA